MATIIYGINGEGMGHISRSVPIISELKKRGYHVVSVGAKNPGNSNKHINIDSINFDVGKNGKIKIGKLARNFLSYDFEIEQQKLQKHIGLIRMVITDYEPVTARFARKHNFNLISVDNQQRFSKINWNLPPTLLAKNMLLKEVNKRFIGPVDKRVIICFHKQQGSYGAPIVDPLEPSIGDHHLVYLRPEYVDDFLNRKIPNCKVYTSGAARFLSDKVVELDREAFKKDLASCKSVISHAGNQLICETMYYNKPISVVPIKGQIEQAMNAWYISNENIGKVYKSINAVEVNTSPPEKKKISSVEEIVDNILR